MPGCVFEGLIAVTPQACTAGCGTSKQTHTQADMRCMCIAHQAHPHTQADSVVIVHQAHPMQPLPPPSPAACSWLSHHWVGYDCCAHDGPKRGQHTADLVL